MAVAFDAVGPNSGGATSSASSTLSWSHTCTGSNLLLTVNAIMSAAPESGQTLSVTYNGVSMNSVLGIVEADPANGGNHGYLNMFYLAAPATGANTVLVTMVGTVSGVILLGGSVSFTGVDQVTPVSNAVSAGGVGTSASLSVSSAAGNMVIDGICNGTGAPASTQTTRWSEAVNSSRWSGNGGQSSAAGAASVNMGYTITSDHWGMIGFNINAVGAATNNHFLSCMGAGS